MVTKVTPIRPEDEIPISKMFKTISKMVHEHTSPDKPLSWGKISAGAIGALAVVGGLVLAFKQFGKSE
jgi:hypothetical protein